MYDDDEFHIVSVQPYVVFCAGQLYRHVTDCIGLTYFYSFAAAEKDLHIPVLADGCSDILFIYRDGKVFTEVLYTAGGTKFIDVKKGSDCFGVRFMPGENPCLDYSSGEKLKDSGLLLRLEQKMSQETTFIPRMCAFLEEYRTEFKDSVPAQKKLFRQIIRLIAEKKGILKISELEVLTGYSARYINHIFENQAGISAKQFCKCIKMHLILQALSTGTEISFSKISSEYKFYDQAHFIHEFKEFTGKTPGEYASAVEESLYSDCIVDV
ncbi:AraC family transcriptional regulator [Treponema rectale]|uniref:AraC family transcriptional regulator n=1 Tax=Treponema rectale TaxID=744512 RepID=A0A840SBD8_9SPIR|nr:helix-turn-helix domain-containing protein [Treponema rectale]MBB5218105.1 AraC-like DNA-binding protein [Treponema rectale]QOS40183.1 AraC family transcriptional regulator [Treponema rectale]